MIERPLAFSPPLVRALLNCEPGLFAPVNPALPYKTETRRIDLRWTQMPERIWVQERFGVDQERWGDLRPRELTDAGAEILRAADFDGEARGGVRWWAARYMPRTLSRLELCVWSDWTEQLQQIDDPGVVAEGFFPPPPDLEDVWDHQPGSLTRAQRRQRRERFAELWDELHRKPGTRWADNPTVTVIRFVRAPPEEDG